MRTYWATTAAIVCLLIPATLCGQDSPALPAAGEVTFAPLPHESAIPDGFRLGPHRFEYKAEPVKDYRSVRMYRVTFPSAVQTPDEANNTVQAEYFQPKSKALGPGVIVLHILGGDFLLSESIAQHLASNGIAAMFVKMPYYGERRSAQRRKMITKNPRESAEGMRQGVLDIRRAAAWLGDRPEVDEERLGITGISLGGVMSALAAGIEPRFSSCAIYLGGGDFGNVLWNHQDGEAVEFRKAWQEAGGSREEFINILRPVDPVTYAPRLRGRRVLMVNATDDEVIPRVSTDALFNAMDRLPDIHWLSAGHYTAVRYLPAELVRLHLFFQGRLKPPLLLRLEGPSTPVRPGEAVNCQATVWNVGTNSVKLTVPEGSVNSCSLARWSVRPEGEPPKTTSAAAASSSPDSARQTWTAEIPPGKSLRLREWIGTAPAPLVAGRYLITLSYQGTAAILSGEPAREKTRPAEIISNPVLIDVRGSE